MTVLSIYIVFKMKIKITKTYCLQTTPKVRSASPFHNELWFYDKNWEFVFWVLEHKDDFITRTDIRIPWLEENLPVYSKDWFMRFDEMREQFYYALASRNYRKFFLQQHDYEE